MFLTSEQLVTLREDDYFDVEVEEGTFRIRPGRTSNVRCLSGRWQGRIFCIHPEENLPNSDHMLLQKTMIEADLETFLQVANY